MKIIRTPLDWDSNPDDNWLHSIDYIETADITVGELNSGIRTGTVTFTQDESGDQEEVTVIQKRVTTFYYPLGTNYRPTANFYIGEMDVASDSNGVAVRVSTPSDEAPDTMLATPKTTIQSFTVSQSAVTFPANGGTINETFTWVDWDKTGVTLHRSTDTVPQEYINSASTSVTTVNSVNGPDWLTLTRNGKITVGANTGEVRSGEVLYTYCGRTATVQVTQEAVPPASDMYFGVKTTSTLAENQRVTFKVDGSTSTVGFSERQGYYVAYIEVPSDKEVSVSCDISYYQITAIPSEWTFSPTGGTKTIEVSPQKRWLMVNNLDLTGCTDLSDLTEISEVTSVPDYSSSVSGEGFSINGNLISATENTTHSARTGEAEFTITEGTRESVTVSLIQECIHWFSFKSTISGSPTSGTVTFYDSPIPNPEHQIIQKSYSANGDTQTVEWEDSRTSSVISYKIEGFEDSGFISASTSSVTFSNIGMGLSGSGVNQEYYLSGAQENVTVSALGVSYTYEKRKNNQPVVSSDYLSGTIYPSEEISVSGTASTTNEFTVSSNTSSNWTYDVESGDPWVESATTVSVKFTAPIPLPGPYSMRLRYTLVGSSLTAQTVFNVPSTATSSIQWDNFVLSSKTAFGVACSELPSGTVPIGSSAYTFAFWPPSRSPMTSPTELRYVHYAELKNSYNQWRLFYPYTPDDGQIAEIPDGRNSFGNYAAKVFALGYTLTDPVAAWTGKNDTWTLGPLLYRQNSGGTYYKVADFKFISGTLQVCQTNATTPQDLPAYPHKDCPIKGLFDSSNYFNISHSIGSDLQTYTISGSAVGKITGESSTIAALNGANFISRTRPMIQRNRSFHYSTSTNCTTGSVDGSYELMAHAVSGSLATNLLGNIEVKIIYHGMLNGSLNLPSYTVPASTYIVTPTTPGDTTSVVYDAETDMYLIYDINNVVILHKQDYTVVPEMEYSGFTRLTEAEIIGPSYP